MDFGYIHRDSRDLLGNRIIIMYSIIIIISNTVRRNWKYFNQQVFIWTARVRSHMRMCVCVFRATNINIKIKESHTIHGCFKLSSQRMAHYTLDGTYDFIFILYFFSNLMGWRFSFNGFTLLLSSHQLHEKINTEQLAHDFLFIKFYYFRIIIVGQICI